MPKKLDKAPHALTAIELRFARYRVIDGLTLGDSYKKCHPKSHMTKDSARSEGFRVWQRVKEKMGTWPEFFERHDIGPERLVRVFDEALGALTYTDVYEKVKSKKVTEGLSFDQFG
ncbi:hypothetical protein LCGC14_2509190 [marine sediment metagenome]|uniref:Uncharacterized protein n=1 Tax=marine sediment metagenome TaxID=412755 RepID=A0A0F9AZM3_9ZZZZ